VLREVISRAHRRAFVHSAGAPLELKPWAACENRARAVSVRLPHFRLGGIYFAYFVFIGAFSPYFSLYLQSIGQAAWQIGLLLSLMQLMRIVAPNLWASLADRHGWRARLLQGTLAVAIATYSGVFITTDFAGLFVVLAAFAFFSSATMPLVEAITLTRLRDRIEGYGAIRLWGSVGFIAAVLGVGWLLDRIAIANLLWLLLAPLAATLAFAATLRDAPGPHRAAGERFLPHALRPEVVALLGANLLMNVAHGPLYAFYSIYLDGAGYSKTLIGALWSLGVVAEIAVFLAAPWWMRRFGAYHVLLACFALAVVRFALIGWSVGSLGLLVAAQIAHAATFGACHMASVALMNRWFGGARQVRGQALYMSIAFGVGGFLGTAASGLAWDAIGPAWTFTAASAAAAAGLLLLAARAKLLKQVSAAAAGAAAS
jgi:MFS transporter, PPP family, 3-phenylpropionic acid transporter